MTVPIVFLFLSDLSVAQYFEPIPYQLNLSGNTGPGRVTIESAILSDIDDRDTFCNGSANAIFPDSFASNIYYRCWRNRRETWKCSGDSYFDRNKLKCSSSNGLQRSTDPCHQQEDGLYPLYSTNCRHYVRCKGGITVDEKQCRANELFSFNLQSCRISSHVKCVQPHCSQNNDGFFTLPGTKCQAYYFCRKGVRFDFLCPRGQTFDLNAKTCVDGGICYEPICVGRVNGMYADTTHNCERYFLCRGGELWEIISCPRFLKHNGFMCVPADNVKCEKPEKTAVAVYNRHNDECKALQDGNHIVSGTDCRKIRICIGGRTISTMECPYNYRFSGNQCYRRDLIYCDELCAGIADGYYPDESKNCREYYYCMNGILKERRKCEEGTAFHNNICSPYELITCGKLKSKDELCNGLEDGFHPDYQHGCQKYFYCHHHQTIVINNCLNGMKWNGSHCTYEYQCGNPKPLSQCKGVVAGLYQDLGSNCTNYIYCKNDEGVVLKCSNGQLHDGTKCRDANEYTCPNAMRDECYNQPDGYRQDERSNCRSYYFCSRGTKITYLCPDNMVFNGTQCVSPKVYVCPYQSHDCNGKYNGYYPDAAAGCKKYFYCFDEKRITTLHCGGNKIFNGDTCVLAVNAKETCSSIVSNPCHRRKDGKYTDSISCEKYVECRNQQVVEEKRCPRGSSYDGTTCSHHFVCPSKPNKTCGGNTLFIPDYNSGCKNYYFCVGNLKMLATCPNETIFNGKVCQDIKTYKCPAEGD